MSESEIPKAYEPQGREDEVYKRWETSGFFNPDTCIEKGVAGKKSPAFTIVLPPPNATGMLHIGHAMMLAIEDLMIRYHRMKGDKTLWIPGTDHAAIATNAIVERQLKTEGKTKQDVGREAYVERVKAYIAKSQENIRNQLRKMGSSLDWSREAYTWDENRNLAVRTMFKKMYDDGLIHRGNRIVNWCPNCHSTLSDEEVVYKEEDGKFYWIKYGPFVLATARPETKLGDTAVAVHPDDERYKDMIGKKYMIPGVLGEFEIVVVGDESVDSKFGTGAVKVTPAHSFADYEIAERHGVPLKQIINEDGRMMENCGKYAGLTTREAREAIVADMQNMGLVHHIDEHYTHNISLCYRCNNIVEPLPSKQWFVGVNKKFAFKQSRQNPIKGLRDGQEVTLKELMQHVVRSKQINIIPDRFDKTYFHWIDNLHDWCISRQIWVGHQIPVWYKRPEKEIKITFLRHGQSEANLKKVAAGHADSPLTKQGENDARALGAKINSSDYDVVFSSDLVRAKRTAELIFGDQHKEIIEDKRLREIDFGDLTGKSTDNKKFDDCRVLGFPGGENYYEVRDRVLSFLSELIDGYSGKKVAIVAHSGVWKVLEFISGRAEFCYDHLKTHATREPVDYTLDKIMYVGIGAPLGGSWEQDLDTLDTWFSAGLWTFSTLGWPDKNAKDLVTYHPTNVLETMFDILFFWVARMIMMSTYALGEIPFETVYLHARVLDKDGEKMSKSKPETMIDPLDVCKKYGTDAVRLSLVMGVGPGADIRLSEEKIAGFRNFTNKLWNIGRYIIITTGLVDANIKAPKPRTLADKWILMRLREVTEQVTHHLDQYEFSLAGDCLRDFTWNELADWYLEISKLQIADAKLKKSTKHILQYLLMNVLRLWHPFMPFVTEVLWEKMGCETFLMVAKWPKWKKGKQKKVREQFEQLQRIISSIRNVRSTYNIEPTKEVSVTINTGKKTIMKIITRGNKKWLADEVDVINQLARVSGVQIIAGTGDRPQTSANTVVGQIEISVDLAGVIDTEKERARLQKAIDETRSYTEGLQKKLENKEFRGNAPKDVVAADEKRLADAQEKLAKLEEQFKSLGES